MGVTHDYIDSRVTIIANMETKNEGNDGLPGRDGGISKDRKTKRVSQPTFWLIRAGE